MSGPNILIYNPKKHRNEVLEIFKSRQDIFPTNEIAQITEESKLSSEESHYKIVASINDKVVGYAETLLELHKNLWSLNWLAVDKHFQRQGIGSLLLDSIIEWLRQKNVNKLQVETCSCKGEAPARSFYTSHGFVSINTEKDGYAKGHSKITFLKQL